MKTTLKYNLPGNIVAKSGYSASKRSNIESKMTQDHQHDVTYYVKFPKKPVGSIPLVRQEGDCLNM